MPGNTKGRFHVILALAALLAAVPASAELYQYTDQNGITRLTNNKFSVPAEQRSQLEPYSEIQSIAEELEIPPLQEKMPAQAISETVIFPKFVKNPASMGKMVAAPPKAPAPEPGDAVSALPAPEPPAAAASSREPARDRKPSAPKPLVSRKIPVERKKTIPAPAPRFPEGIVESQEHGIAAPPPVEIPPDLPAEAFAMPENAADAPPDIAGPGPIADPAVLPPPPPKTSEEPMTAATPELPTQPPRITAPAEGAPASEAVNPGNTDENAAPDLAALEITRKTLRDRKAILNHQYMILLREKQAIESSVNADDEESVLKYNEKVKKLNLKIYRYKKEKTELQADIEKYNQAVRKTDRN